MKNLGFISVVVSLLGASTAMAQDACVNPESGSECSVGSEAPNAAALLNTIENAGPAQLMGVLEHGEMVECYECVNPLIQRALTDGDAEAREYSAWWLRRRPFAVAMAMRFFKGVLADDPNPVRRARAAEAIGEFLDPNGLLPLRTAVLNDTDATVRRAAVGALGRLNHSGGNTVLATAMTDNDATVRLAALKSANIVNFFQEFDQLVASLGDTDATVRREAALLVGRFHVDSSVPTLAALLRGDESVGVRRSAAWSLGMIGTSEARTALTEAAAAEGNQQVLDAIAVARLMRN